jgi:hypothetical protein
MTQKQHRLHDIKSSTKHSFDLDLDHTKGKRSLGALRKNDKTKPRSPDATGKLHFQRHTLREIYRQLTDSGDDEVICNLACWRNNDQQGPYLTVEISPQFVSFEPRRPKNGSFDDMFNEEDE